MTRLLFSLILGAACVAHADEFAAERAEVLALGKLTSPPAVIDAEGFDRVAGVRAIYFDALNYEGNRRIGTCPLETLRGISV